MLKKTWLLSFQCELVSVAELFVWSTRRHPVCVNSSPNTTALKCHRMVSVLKLAHSHTHKKAHMDGVKDGSHINTLHEYAKVVSDDETQE